MNVNQTGSFFDSELGLLLIFFLGDSGAAQFNIGVTCASNSSLPEPNVHATYQMIRVLRHSIPPQVLLNCLTGVEPFPFASIEAHIVVQLNSLFALQFLDSLERRRLIDAFLQA